MNTAATLQITGAPITTSYASLPAGWSLIGYPSLGSVPFADMPIADYFNATNTISIKSLDGIWEPNGSANTITHFEPGKGYLINKK